LGLGQGGGPDEGADLVGVEGECRRHDVWFN
jgi:hypothetical protein